MENVVSAVWAWLSKARGSDDGAELAIWALRLRESERSVKADAKIAGAGPAAPATS
ncbi:MAG: hypothetical protein HY765_03150 [Rhodomicrobium sp.]|jgi:hypothetical protein|nr:hypothetical protein [Rhodomicrobium sp.]